MAHAPTEAPIEPNLTMTRGTHPFSLKCPRFDCFYSTAHASVTMAQYAWDEHLTRCPDEGKSNEFMEERDERGQRYTMLRVGKSLLEKLWDSLDSSFDEFQTKRDQMELEYYKGRMRGIAESIQMMSSHYFITADEVVVEEMKRAAIRKGEREFEPTPGYKYNPPLPGSREYEKANKQGSSNFDPEKTTRAPKQRVAKTPVASMVSLGVEVDQKIINALATGFFEPEDIAVSFKVDVAYVKALADKS